MKSPEKEWAEGWEGVRRMPCHRNKTFQEEKGVDYVKCHSVLQGQSLVLCTQETQGKFWPCHLLAR